MVFERAGQIDRGEPRRVLAAPLDVQFIVEAFLCEIALFVSDPIVEPAVRLVLGPSARSTGPFT